VTSYSLSLVTVKMANYGAQQAHNIETKHRESTCELTVTNGKLSSFKKYLHHFKKTTKGKPFSIPKRQPTVSNES